jgi:hypothetical protein
MFNQLGNSYFDSSKYPITNHHHHQRIMNKVSIFCGWLTIILVTEQLITP